MEFLFGIVSGIFATSLVFSIVLVIRRSIALKRTVRRNEIVREIADLWIDIDNGISGARARGKNFEHLKRELLTKQERVSRLLKMNMSELDIYYAKFIELQLKEYWTILNNLPHISSENQELVHTNIQSQTHLQALPAKPSMEIPISDLLGQTLFDHPRPTFSVTESIKEPKHQPVAKVDEPRPVTLETDFLQVSTNQKPAMDMLKTVELPRPGLSGSANIEIPAGNLSTGNKKALPLKSEDKKTQTGHESQKKQETAAKPAAAPLQASASPQKKAPAFQWDTDIVAGLDTKMIRTLPSNKPQTNASNDPKPQPTIQPKTPMAPAQVQLDRIPDIEEFVDQTETVELISGDDVEKGIDDLFGFSK